MGTFDSGERIIATETSSPAISRRIPRGAVISAARNAGALSRRPFSDSDPDRANKRTARRRRWPRERPTRIMHLDPCKCVEAASRCIASRRTAPAAIKPEVPSASFIRSSPRLARGIISMRSRPDFKATAVISEGGVCEIHERNDTSAAVCAPPRALYVAPCPRGRGNNDRNYMSVSGELAGSS